MTSITSTIQTTSIESTIQATSITSSNNNVVSTTVSLKMSFNKSYISDYNDLNTAASIEFIQIYKDFVIFFKISFKIQKLILFFDFVRYFRRLIPHRFVSM